MTVPAGSDAPGVVPGSRTRRGDLTRARILEAARSTFRESGWHRARVEDVCKAAGIGHGTYYAYYANKTAVLEALVRQHASALYALAGEPWTSGDVRADVHRVIAGFVTTARSDRDLREVWLAAAPGEPGLAALIDEVRDQFVARVRGNLAQAAQSGLTRPGLDVELAAIALTAMVEHTVALDPPVDGDRLVQSLTDLWVSAVYQ